MKKRVAIYARVSSMKQKEGENIQSQVSALLEYANNQGYTIPNGWIFTDEGISGSTLQRPALETLRELVHEDEIDLVLIYSPDRLSRKYAYQLLLEMEFQKKSVQIHYFNTPSAQTPEDQLSLHFKGIFAEYERAQIIERCRRGRIYKAKQGCVSVIPTAPYGYDYIKKANGTSPQYIINQNAVTVKKIFMLYVKEGFSLSKIGCELEQNGILSPTGLQKWDHSTVRDILKNEAYIGTAYFGKTERSEGISGRIFRIKGKKHTETINASRARPKELWIPITVPQIVSESDFELAQIKLEENKKLASRNTKQPSILQGLLVCGHCKSSYYKKARGKNYSYYSCGKRLTSRKCLAPSIRVEELDNLVWNHVIELLNNPRLLEIEIERRAMANNDHQATDQRLKEIDKELIRLSKAKDKLLDAYQDGECLTLEGLKGRLKSINLKFKSIEKEKKSLTEFVNNEQRIDNLKSYTKNLQNQLQNSENLSIIQKQKVLRLVISEILITDEEVEVKHCIPYYEDFGLLIGDGYLIAQVGVRAKRRDEGLGK